MYEKKHFPLVVGIINVSFSSWPDNFTSLSQSVNCLSTNSLQDHGTIHHFRGFIQCEESLQLLVASGSFQYVWLICWSTLYQHKVIFSLSNTVSNLWLSRVHDRKCRHIELFITFIRLTTQMHFVFQKSCLTCKKYKFYCPLGSCFQIGKTKADRQKKNNC